MLNCKQQAALSLIDAGQWIDHRHWCPATGGNFSCRYEEGRALVTASSKHKGKLTPEDFLDLNLQGEILTSTEQKPSAEAELHLQLYRLDARIGAVLHTHSVAATVLSRLVHTDCLKLSGYEMQKSLKGNSTHQAEIAIHIFENDQNMKQLAGQLEARWQQSPLQWGFLVKGHGLYAWGETVEEARRHLEGLEFLFSCELELQRIGVKQ